MDAESTARMPSAQVRSKMSGVNLLSSNERQVLSSMVESSGPSSETIEVSYIGQVSGIGEHDEIVRALYNLEGKNLVEPVPKGDFTSQVWKVTGAGAKALELL